MAKFSATKFFIFFIPLLKGAEGGQSLAEGTFFSVSQLSQYSFIPLAHSKRTYPLHFLTYQAFKSREGIFFRTNLAERFKMGYF